MKALCVTDAHGAPQALEALEKFLQLGPEAAIVCGDITQRGGPAGYFEKFMSAIRAKGIPIFAVHGNMDTPETAKALEDSGAGIHAKRVEWKGAKLAGLGGASRSILNTPTEYEEGQMEKFLEGNVDKDTIVVSHAPPGGTKADGIGEGVHIGSFALRRAVEALHPRAVVCGHAHENQGIEMLGSTKIIKVRALKDGKAALVDLGTLAVEFLG